VCFNWSAEPSSRAGEGSLPLTVTLLLWLFVLQAVAAALLLFHVLLLTPGYTGCIHHQSFSSCCQPETRAVQPQALPLFGLAIWICFHVAMCHWSEM
jgi:hypothetical protein